MISYRDKEGHFMAKDPIPHKRQKTLNSHMHPITVLQNI